MHSGKKNYLPIPQWDTSGHICVALSPRLKHLGCLFIPSLANSHLQQLVQESSLCISCCPSATFFVPDQWRVNIFFSGWLKKKERWEEKVVTRWKLRKVEEIPAFEMSLLLTVCESVPGTVPTFYWHESNLLSCSCSGRALRWEEKTTFPSPEFKVHENKSPQ